MKNRKPQSNLASKHFSGSPDLEETGRNLKHECLFDDKSPDTSPPTEILNVLVLDDFLAQINEACRSFKIALPELSLDRLGLSRKTSNTVERIFQDTIERHQRQIVTTAHSLLDDLGDDIYGEEIETEFAPRHLVALARQRDALRRVLELGLQVIVSLPSEYPCPRDGKALDGKAQKSLISALRRRSEEVCDAADDDVIRAKLELLSAVPKLKELSSAMQSAAEVLDSVARMKVIKVRQGSPNPQVRFALYLVNWIKTCASRPNYAVLADLIQAAFYASKKEPPAWTNRLEIEMNREIKSRAKWAQALLSRPYPAPVQQPPAAPSNLTK